MRVPPEVDSPTARLMQWSIGDACGPWYITIHPTNRCNLTCAICWQRKHETIDYANELSEERLLRLVDECAQMGVREWTIVGGGDPMLRADTVIKMCEQIRRHGMNGNIQCNGTNLGATHFERLVDLEWQEVFFSVDGPDADINDRIRCAGAFEKATANIQNLAGIRHRRGAHFPRMYLYHVIVNLNYDKLHLMVELSHKLGCDGVKGTPLIPETGVTEHLTLNAEQLGQVPQWINKATARANEIGLENNYHWLSENIQPSRYGLEKKGRKPGDLGFDHVGCIEPWLSLIVRADGKTGPCCAFWDDQAPNIAEQSISEIWNGYIAGVRHGILEDSFPPYCSTCQPCLRTRTEITLKKLKEDVPGQFRQMRGFKNAACLVRKTQASIRRHGFFLALYRGLQWFYITCR